MNRSLLLLLLLPSIAGAQMPDLRLPISLDADSTRVDVRNSTINFEGLRLSQGNIGVEADEGQATRLDFDNSVWKLSGNVVLDFANGHVVCDGADLHFSNFQLTLAMIDGTPATFELRRPGTDDVTYAEARQLVYDLAEGTVAFSGDAKIIESGNQISSSYLVYDIVEQSISAESAGDGSDRVQVTYTPPDEPTSAATDDDTVDRESGSGDSD